MAMSSITRRASSTVLSPAVRPIASPRILSLSTINNTIRNSAREHGAVKTGISSCFSNHFCTDTRKLIDYKLITTVNSQIKLEKDLPPVPAGFPFRIEDPHNRSCIYLRREIDGEKIEIKVRTPHESEYTKDSFAELLKAGLAPSVTLDVTISKENGKELKFEVSATSDDIRVTRLSVEEPDPSYEHDPFGSYPFKFGPYLVKDGDIDMQLALREFLEIRGVIDNKYVGFLYKYMVRVYTRRSVRVLEKLNTFVKE